MRMCDKAESSWVDGAGNGNPLQCSCLENPRDREVWWAAIYGVTQSLTQLSSSSWIEDHLSELSDSHKTTVQRMVLMTS